MNTTMVVQQTRRPAWVPVAALCAGWLVLQNAMLFALVAFTHPTLPAAVLVGAARTLARVVGVAAETVVGILTVAQGGLPSSILSTLTGGLL